jgi:hypothetical protein
MKKRSAIEQAKSGVRIAVALVASIIVVALFAAGYTGIIQPDTQHNPVRAWAFVATALIVLVLTVRFWKNWFFGIPGTIGGRVLIALAFGARFPDISFRWLITLCVLMVATAVLSIRFREKPKLSGFDQLNLLIAALSVLISIPSLFGMLPQNPRVLFAVGIGDIGLFLSWVRSRMHGESPERYFALPDSVAINVRDVAAAKRWYSEKLGLCDSSTEEEEASMALGHSADDARLYLVETSGKRVLNNHAVRPPIIFSRRLAAAHEYLSSQGVAVSPLQQDSGGNKYFRFRDPEDNELEVCQWT